MTAVLAFALALFLAAIVSDYSRRSIVSSAVVFLVAGWLVGGGGFGLVRVRADAASVRYLAQIVLFSVLFTDGTRTGLDDLRRGWRAPGRALLVGMPLTLGLTALAAHVVVGVRWREAFLLGAVLSPTDPVFAAALVQRAEVPWRLRHLLNVESGLNDGLALPIVLGILATYDTSSLAFRLAGSVAAGLAVGVAIAWCAVRVTGFRFLGVSDAYQRFVAVAVAMIVYATAGLLHANEFLAAFAAGATLSSTGGRFSKAFREFGEGIADLLKFAGVLLFGTLLAGRLFQGFGLAELAFVGLALVVARPLAIGIALLGSRLSRKEKLVAAWFGPKGFASVVFAILVLRSGAEQAGKVFQLAAVVIAASIVVHSSTDVLVARRVAVPPEEAQRGELEEEGNPGGGGRIAQEARDGGVA